MIKLLNNYNKLPLVAKATIWFVVCSMLQKCLGFITVPIYTRLMSVHEYGVYSTFLSWHSIMTVFCSLNISTCVYINNYTKAKTQQEKDSAAVPLLSLSIVFTFVIFIIYLIASSWIAPIIGMSMELTCLMFVDILVSLSIPFWTVQQRFRYNYKIVVAITLSLVISNAFMGILFVYLSNENQALARVVSVVLVNLVFGTLFYFHFWNKAKSVFSTDGWFHALKVQLPTIPHALSIHILHSSDKILITNIVGVAHTAIYSVAYSAGFVVNVLKNSIVDAMKPWVYEKIKSGSYSEIAKVTNAVLVFVFIITVFFCAFAPEIIYIMAPSKYYEAIYVIPPIAASSFFTFLYNMFSIVGIYFEKTSVIMWASIAGAVINVVLNILLIPVLGYLVAAYSTLISFIFFAFAHYFIMCRICREKINQDNIYDIKYIVLMSLVSLVFMVLFTIIYPYPAIRYLLLSIISLVLILKRRYFIQILKTIKKKQ